MDRINSLGLSVNDVCLLDPKAELELSPEDGDGRFKWFLFGVSHCAIVKSIATHQELRESSEMIRRGTGLLNSERWAFPVDVSVLSK